MRTHYTEGCGNVFLETPTLGIISMAWEFDLVVVQGLSKYNDGVKYLLTVIDVFSKFLHIIPLIRKTGKAVTTAFQSILKDPKYLKPKRRRPVLVRTDRGKEFLNRSFQDMLRREGIQFQIFKTPMSNAQSSKELTALSGINYTNTSHIRIRRDLLTYSRNS